MSQPVGNISPENPAQSLGYASQQSPPVPPLGITGIISWIVIAGCIAMVVAVNQLNANRRTAQSPQLLEPNVPLEMVARYAVGLNAASKSAAPQPAVDPMVMILQQLDAAAKTLPDKLRVAIVVGELKGAPAALTRISAAGASAADPSLKNDVRLLTRIYTEGLDRVDATGQKQLLDRYGWYAHLAFGFGRPESDPDRQLATIAAHRAMIAMLVGGIAIVIAFLVGFALLILALVRLADGKITRAYVPAMMNTTPFLEAFALYLALYGVVPYLILKGSSGRTHLGLVAYLVMGVLPVAFALVWPLLRGVPAAEWRLGLGWHLGTGLIREMFCGITGYLAGLPILAAGAIVTVSLTKLTGANTTHPIVNQAEGLGSAMRLLLLAAVFAPLAEESLFRGALFHHLRSRHAWLLSSVVVSLIFAAMHPQGWAAVPTLGAIAMTFAAIREWRGTVVASATAHALNNGSIMIMLIAATS
jgi:membrane protease YdiL (CAAX protease family)